MTPEVKCVIGCGDMKPGAVGTLALLSTGIQFTTAKQKVDIATSSITDIFTGAESRQDISGAVGTGLKAAVPYGGGRVLSLFSHGVEVLTVEFTDANGGVHGAIFVLGKGKATEVKNQLVAQGAKTSSHIEVPAQSDDTQQPKEQKP